MYLITVNECPPDPPAPPEQDARFLVRGCKVHISEGNCNALYEYLPWQDGRLMLESAKYRNI